MMQTKNREKLTELEYTLEGAPVKIAGWKMPYASISGGFPGFWRASWDTIERAASNGGQLTVNDVTLASTRWLGDGKTETPAALRWRLGDGGLAMQTEHRSMTIRTPAGGVNVGLYDYGDGDVLIEIDSPDGGALLRPADIFEIIAFLRTAVERSKTNEGR